MINHMATKLYVTKVWYSGEVAKKRGGGVYTKCRAVNNRIGLSGSGCGDNPSMNYMFAA